MRVARRDVRVDSRLPHLAREPPRVVGRERFLVPRLEGRDWPLLRVAQQVGPSATLDRELRCETDLQPLLRTRQQLLTGGARSVGANPPRVQVAAGVKIVRVLHLQGEEERGGDLAVRPGGVRASWAQRGVFWQAHLEPKREGPRRAPLAAQTITSTAA